MAGFKLAFRMLTRTPFVTAVAVISLALGIGANTAIFTLFDHVLLRSLPVQDPEGLVNLAAPGPKSGNTSCGLAGDCESIFSYPMFLDLQAARTGFSGIAAHVAFGANLAYEGQTISGRGHLVSGSYFPLLGVRPELGRVLSPADDRNVGENFVAVLSHGYWETQLGADPDVLNRAIVVNGQPMTIVGVAARGFEGTTLGSAPDVYVPVTMRGLVRPGWEGFEDRQSYWAYLFARLEPGVSIEQARAEANTAYSSIIREVEAPLQSGMSDATMERFLTKEITVEPGSMGQSTLHADSRTPLLLLSAITGIVLLIACANIANLLLARGANRSREMAIRGSIGASRRQLLLQLLTESVLLGLLGGLASLLVARWTLGVLAAALPTQAAATVPAQLSGSVILFAAALSLGTGLLFGLYPAMHSTRDLVSALKDGAGQASGARAASRFRSGLVTAQLALSMALLVAAGLFLKSLMNVSRIDLGMEADNVVTFGISPELNGHEPTVSIAMFERAEEELAAIPGVRGVTASMVPLFTGSNWGTNLTVEGFEAGPDVDTNARMNIVGPGYFRTLGIPLIAGREFTDADADGSPKVVIVNETFVRKFNLDGRRAVGKFLTQGAGDVELDTAIVGVVQDSKYAGVKQENQPLFFKPYRQEQDLGAIYFYLRTAGDPGAVMRAIPGVIERLDPNLPVEDLKTLDQQIQENVTGDRMLSTLAAAFAVLATLLAAVGLYGVLAYTVMQRTREIGVRMALGAAGRDVRGMVLRQVGRMTIIGGLVGLAAALGLGRAAATLLYEMEGNDPVVVIAVVVLLAVVALAAGYLPALRASRVDPMRALRYE